MKQRRLVSIATLAVTLAAAVGGLAVVGAGSERTAPVAAEVRPAPQSCKPVAPVHVTLEPGAAPGVWHVHLNAVASANDVTVVVGSNRGDVAAGSLVVWHGSLEPGAGQAIEARFPVADDVTSVWAEARIASAPGVTQRDLAVLEVLNGKAAARTASSAATGRVVTDPQTGESVVEFQGETAGKR